MSRLFDEKGYPLPEIQRSLDQIFESPVVVKGLFDMCSDRVEVLALQSYIYWEVNELALERLIDIKDENAKPENG